MNINYLAFFQEFFSGGRQNLLFCKYFCYTDFSIVLGPNSRGGGQKVSEGANCLKVGGAPLPPCGRKPVKFFGKVIPAEVLEVL